MASHNFYQAAIAHFEAQRLEALAELSIYFTSSVGIGDHSNHLQDIIAWTKKLGDAEDCLESLKRNFTVADPNVNG